MIEEDSFHCRGILGTKNEYVTDFNSAFDLILSALTTRAGVIGFNGSDIAELFDLQVSLNLNPGKMSGGFVGTGDKIMHCRNFTVCINGKIEPDRSDISAM